MTTFLQFVIDAINLASLNALIALGIAMVFGIMRLVNFAHGEIIMLGAYTLYALTGQPVIILILGALAVAAGVALVMERVAFRPVRESSPTTLLVMSFAVSFLLQNLMIGLVGSIPKTLALPGFLNQPYFVGGLLIQKATIITVVTTVVLLVGLAVFLKKTPLGTQMRAAAEDFTMSRLLGVRANRVIAAAFAISGLLAGVVSVLLVWQTGFISPQMGIGPVLIGFVATIIGGMGSLAAAALGGFLLGAVTAALQAWLPFALSNFRDAFAFSIVILVLVLRPQGLLGSAEEGV